MICTVCREAQTKAGFTSIQFERDEFRATVHQVPAVVCPACGESYLDEVVAADLLSQLQEIMARGEIDIVLEYS